MTTEEKARAYDEALEIAKDMINRLEKGENILLKADLNLMFSQLKESEDERIRKAIIETLPKYGYLPQTSIKVEDAIAWLEKQGEQKVSYTTLVETGNGGINALVQGELPADKIEPKFKVGDWIINRTDATIMQIVNNKDFYESVEISGQRRTDTYNYVEWDFRLWTIEDAKDGDVLVDGLGNVCIYQEPSTKLMYHSYCYGNNKCFIDKGGSHEIVGSYPANKEQRDLLFQKMKEEIYEWDEEKKGWKLKKIEQKPDWIEEDEEMINDIIDYIKAMPIFFESTKGKSGKEYTKEFVKNAIKWLKSLKDRCAWKL